MVVKTWSFNLIEMSGLILMSNINFIKKNYDLFQLSFFFSQKSKPNDLAPCLEQKKMFIIRPLSHSHATPKKKATRSKH